MITQYKDEELLTSLRNDDEDAFREIYNKYWRKLYIVAANRVDNEQDAEEIVQDIFAALWVRRKCIVITDNGLGKYLTSSVKYRVIKTLGRYALKQNYLNAIPANSCIDDSTQQWLAFEELKEELAKYVSQLPEKCQIVFKMSRELGYSQKRIAAELSISEKTVEAHLQKAFKVLRSKLASIVLTLL
ncbi:RNA polymerase sigma-70 factor [Mucilaginibacter sp. JC4]|uniref:RNA polymerase sigma-70 factor n=2 Tax=Mucilaginibacter aquariorum TaxID=2967225 RepID=A0ABT1T819_9SPHI|nr:RNA polymerase sigma-70 factor [Mucilaginibacter aquariorum]MCQ6960766.1 RNA polymerase sigma-70 factor [Mucilaginibacter aquariorum]